MRGKDTQQSAMFSYVSAERRVPADEALILTKFEQIAPGLKWARGAIGNRNAELD
jgi:hypothetical protein